MHYLGSSYGHLIFSNSNQCLLVDVYSGANVRPPKLKSSVNHYIYYGILVAPLNSPNSQLLLFSRSSMFQWQVGSSSWSEYENPFNGERIIQIVFFKGEMFAMDEIDRIYNIRLGPQLNMHEVEVDCGEGIAVDWWFMMHWLVVCGDKLLWVDLSRSSDHLSGIFEVFRLDFSVKPAKWVKVENLGNHAIFVSFDRRDPTFSCVSPERWGGRSNCIYVANQPKYSDEPWTVAELGQEASPTTWNFTCISGCSMSPDGYGNQPPNLRVLPSLVYDVGQ